VKGEIIPDSDNIARLCKPSTAPDGVIQASAFLLKDSEESLSVNWLEFLDCTNRLSEIIEMQRVYARKLKVGRSAKIAILNVGEIRDLVRTETQDNRNIEVLHDPDELHDDPSHSEVVNMRPDNEFIAELICEVIRETHPAR
jgi:hypothetical protein